MKGFEFWHPSAWLCNRHRTFAAEGFGAAPFQFASFGLGMGALSRPSPNPPEDVEMRRASVPEEEIEEMEESKTYRDVDDSLMTREGSPAGTRTPGLRPSGLAPDLAG